MRIKREDMVQVIAGKDKGKRGKVQQVLPREGKLLVEGANVITRHVRPRPNIRQAGIVRREAPLDVAKVMLICTHCNRPVRVGHTFLENEKKVRVCRSCKEVID